MKKIYLLLFIFASALNYQSFAQVWAVRYNGTGNGIDEIKGTVVDNAGNVYVTGASNSGANSDDFITIKYNSSGVQQWIARFNGPGNGSDIPGSIFVDPSGYVYVTGYCDQLTGTFINNDVLTVKYSPAGAQLWTARFDGDRQRADAGNAVKTDASGNVFVTGYTTVRNGAYTKKDYLTIKYNAAGVRQWVATYNGPGNQDDEAVGIGIDGSGNVYVTGTSFAGRDPVGEEDYLTIKYSTAGVQQWVQRYNGPISEPDRATAIAVDQSGNSVVTGYSRGSDLDIATVKYSSSGTQLWVARYDGPAHGGDLAYAVTLDNSGNVYVAGSDQATAYNSDFCTLKYNPGGVLQWHARYASTVKDNDEAFAVATDKAGNVFVTGYINGVSPSWDIATIKYNSAGVQQWAQKYDGPGKGNDNGVAIGVDGNGNVYVGANSLGKTSNLDFLLLKYSPSGTSTAARGEPETTITAPVLKSKLVIYPNPADKYFKLAFSDNRIYDIVVTDAAGKTVFANRRVNAYVLINCEKFKKGTYFVEARSGGNLLTGLLIKQ